MTVKIGGNYSSGTNLLHVVDSTGNGDALVKIEAEAGADAELLLDTSNGGGAAGHVVFQMDGTAKGGIDYYNAGTNINCMIFRTGTNTERLRIKSDGDIVATGNLKTNNITGKNMVINGSFQVDQRMTDQK